MEEIVIATRNSGKVKDFEQLLQKRNIKVKSLLDYPNLADVEETGTTFFENAVLKAEQISSELNRPVIADDSGLIVDALNGRPGVYSARYAGEEKNDEANLEKVLEELRGLKMEFRTARFHCSLAVARPGHPTEVIEGECAGVIAEQPSGDSGFGYDPIFYLPEKNKTMAQLTKEEKNEISHRAKAMEKLDHQWKQFFS